MNKRVIEVEADTIEEAIEKGLKRLGQDDQADTDIEILEDPEADPFNAGSDQAKIRMTGEGIDLLDSLESILSNILERMGLTDFEVETTIDGEYYRADIDSDQELRFVIGRYGETLNALQHVTERMLNTVSDQALEVVVDADNYRDRRRRDLVKLAEDVSSQVLEEDREIELEPMIGVERKIVHETIRNIDGVKSHSIGEDTNRRVVILPKGQS